MSPERVVRVSKYLSRHLRHRPDAIGLTVDAAAMAAARHSFRRSANAVWLVEAVPAEFIRFPS